MLCSISINCLSLRSHYFLKQTIFFHYQLLDKNNIKKNNTSSFGACGDYFEEGDRLTSTFKKGISDLNGKSRRNDSEAKFIFNFIQKHIHTADEFVIETKNIYFTCTSCQRELLMLQEYAAGLGKKVEIIIHGDESLKGGKDLFNKLNN